jgi:hypothetical protein
VSPKAIASILRENGIDLDRKGYIRKSEVECIICNTLFKPTKFQTKALCSEECRSTHRKAVRKEQATTKRFDYAMGDKRRSAVTDPEIILAVRTSTSMRGAAKAVNLSLRAFKRRAKHLRIYNPASKAKQIECGKKLLAAHTAMNTIPLKEILGGLHPRYNKRLLFNRLFNEEVKEYKCESCGADHWEGIPVKLRLHYKNGCSHDHRLNNLLVVCGNCKDNARDETRSWLQLQQEQD